MKPASTSDDHIPSIALIAQEQFGFGRLRPGQEKAIRAALDGHDTLAIMPTRSGKSAIYQIVGLINEHITIVVSPLIVVLFETARYRTLSIDLVTERGLLQLAPGIDEAYTRKG